MGNDTKVTTVMLGGALAVVFLYVFGPTLTARFGAPPLGLEGGLTVLFAAILAWLLPSDVLRKITRRTKTSGLPIPDPKKPPESER